MKNIVVTYSAEATIATVPFENVKPHFGMSAELDEGENPREVFQRIKALVDGLLEQEYAETKARVG